MDRERERADAQMERGQLRAQIERLEVTLCTHVCLIALHACLSECVTSLRSIHRRRLCSISMKKFALEPKNSSHCLMGNLFACACARTHTCTCQSAFMAATCLFVYICV
jgi:hypothetical protein